MCWELCERRVNSQPLAEEGLEFKLGGSGTPVCKSSRRLRDPLDAQRDGQKLLVPSCLAKAIL